jgi:hypothetical protein
VTVPLAPNDRRFSLIAALLFGLVLAPQGCGGDSASKKGAGSADEAAGSTDDSAEVASNDSEASEEAEAEPARGPNCDDGTCSMCAGSLCPNGWYCDESAKACSWLRECPEKPSCGCVTKVLGASCKCREEGGIPHVECS